MVYICMYSSLYLYCYKAYEPFLGDRAVVLKGVI